MKSRNMVLALSLCGFLAASHGVNRAAETKAPAKGADQAPAMTPEQKAEMEAWQKAGTPTQNHKALEPLVGSFHAKQTMWPAPGAPPQESEGSSENRWVLGGRYLEQRYKGTVWNQPFEGLGYTGYDNVMGKYVGSWMDSFSTGIAEGEGMGTPTVKEMTFMNTMSDPMTGKSVKMRSVMNIIDRDHHTYTMFMNGPDGKEYKGMEIIYTRKK